MKLTKPLFLSCALLGLCLAAGGVACNNTPPRNNADPNVQITNAPSINAKDPDVDLHAKDIQAPHIDSRDIQAPHARTPQVGDHMDRTDAGTSP